ncbi:putative cytoplasmic metal-dependent hydrolase (TatD family protein) [Desulforapulum autotrophicum HRM2]|uniref:Cytoplasmic metal-dependent hydrolase (TatD family protein) n=1 Tax=Desulforapulum autotrophicum (strain ATCC 43914 / DSM 3382 / VKM B-1955 / HRM2) TaxID=177437 RepID=C0QAC2_DESAH|nr:putative cytoplasmic metal-dependent hydrolase (TatD family protein) [Desulforapulum autotrophicum HRM2]
MNLNHINFVDSHMHLDLVQKSDPDRIQWIKKVHCLAVSWAFAKHIDTTADLHRALALQRETIHHLNSTGLPCFYLSGVHPRNIPPDLKTGAVADLIMENIDDKLCLGMGEIGLETASNREKDIFSAQMSLAPQIIGRDKVIGIHTPRKDKQRVTREILALLENLPDLRDSIVIDHCTLQTIGTVLEQGFRAGITVSPVKTSGGELRQIVARYPDHLDRIMLNTDSGDLYYEDLYMVFMDPGMPESLKTALTRDNALIFYKKIK